MSNPTNLQSRLRESRERSALPTLPPKDPRDIGPTGKVKQSSVGLPVWQWERINEICEAEAYAVSELMREIVRSFIDEYDAAKAAPKKTSAK